MINCFVKLILSPERALYTSPGQRPGRKHINDWIPERAKHNFTINKCILEFFMLRPCTYAL